MAIAAVAGLAAAGGAFAAAVAAQTAFTFAAFATSFAIGAGLSMVSRALAPKPNIGSQMRGITQTTREPAGTRKIIYGKMRVGGNVVYIAHSGVDNKYLHLAVVFATHHITAYDEVWFNDNKIWTATGGFQSDWGTYVTMDTTKLGTAAQTASSVLTGTINWTADHKLSGLAYLAFKLEWNQDKFPQGVPNITAVIRGKRVFDPRTNVTGYSTNPALCLRDYMLDQSYGLGESNLNIDSTALEAAADLCDEQVGVKSGAIAATAISSGTTYEIVTVGDTDFTAIGASSNTVGVQFDATGAGTGTGTATPTFQDRYQCNGVIDTANQIKANIEQLLSPMGGKLTYSGGKYFVDGAEYKTPTHTFTEADVISDIQTQTKQSRRGIYNGVKGIFVSEEKNYKVLDYPPQISSTYATEDGDPLYLDMPLPCVTNNLQAQRLAKIALLRSRQQVVITMTVNLKGLQVKVGDTIQVTNDRLSYSSKVFEVIDYSLAIGDGQALAVNLVCIETASAIYDWTTSDEEDFLSGGELDLYDGRTVNNVTSLAYSPIGLKGPDGKVITAVDLTWTAPTDAFVEFYVVTYEKDSDGRVFEFQTREPRLHIRGLTIGAQYTFIVKAQNLIGVRSTGTTLNVASLVGDTTAPSPVTNVVVTSTIKTLVVEWDNPTDIDLKHVNIYVDDSATQPASPVAQVSGTEYVYPAKTSEGLNFRKYFWLEAEDYSGNKSTVSGPHNELILLPKSEEIDGAVSESVTFGIFNPIPTTLSSSLTTFGSFITPAPESGVKKRASLLAMISITAQNASGDFTVGVRIERKSKGETTGTSLGTVIGNGGVAMGARYLEVAGNVMSEVDMYGGIATSATSPSAVYNVVSVEYQESTDRTRIIYSSSTVISSGDIYYNADKWTSAGTYLTYAPFTEPRYNVLGINASADHVIFQPLAASSATEEYRIRAQHHVLTSGTVTMGVGMAGQIQYLR